MSILALVSPVDAWSPRSLLAVLVLASSACGGARPALVTDPHALVGQAPEPVERLARGETVRVPAAGRVTVVDLWATWCKPCEKVMTELVKLDAERRGDGLVIVGVASDDNPGLVREVLAQRGATYANVVDPNGTFRGAYLADRLPTTVLFDRRGRVRAVLVGGEAEDLAALRSDVDLLLGEP
jgi:thiol-disulfide isomerase/thioredoxin